MNAPCLQCSGEGRAPGEDMACPRCFGTGAEPVGVSGPRNPWRGRLAATLAELREASYFAQERLEARAATDPGGAELAGQRLCDALDVGVDAARAIERGQVAA